MLLSRTLRAMLPEQFHHISISGLEIAISFITQTAQAKRLMRQMIRVRGGRVG